MWFCLAQWKHHIMDIFIWLPSSSSSFREIKQAQTSSTTALQNTGNMIPTRTNRVTQIPKPTWPVEKWGAMWPKTTTERHKHINDVHLPKRHEQKPRHRKPTVADVNVKTSFHLLRPFCEGWVTSLFASPEQLSMSWSIPAAKDFCLLYLTWVLLCCFSWGRENGVWALILLRHLQR